MIEAHIKHREIP
jgi:hypothetical protein